MTQPVCKAHRSNGDPCRAYAMKGQRVCSAHGGRSPIGKAAAARRLEEEKARAVALKVTGPVEVDPSQALIDLVHGAAGEAAYWRSEVERLQVEHPERMTMGLVRVEKGTRDRSDVDMRHLEAGVPVAYRMWVEARERLARYATAAIKAGVQERQIKLAEQEGALVAEVIKAILDQLDLSPEQVARVPEVVPAQLRLLARNAG